MASRIIADLPCHPSFDYSQQAIDMFQKYRKSYRDTVKLFTTETGYCKKADCLQLLVMDLL